jgi:hypothetical protein
MSSLSLSTRLLGALCLLLPSASWATPIFVANHSFETSYPLDSGCGFNCFFNQSGAPSWVSPQAPGVGTWNPGVSLGNFTHFNVIPDGALLGYTNSGVTLSQTVGPTVVAGLTYTLLVEVGNRKAYSLDTATVELLIGATSYLATGALGAEGAFSTYTATYTGLLADVGKSIAVRLGATGGGQGNFDNVRLLEAASPVPEPATTGLIAGALTALAWRRRRR